MSEIIDMLDHVVRKQSRTSRYRGSSSSGFGPRCPLNLRALELRDRLAVAVGREYLDLEDEARSMIDRPARLPLGECACGAQVWAEFDRVSAQCRACGEHLIVADSVHTAREYVESTWLSPAEIERETRGWSSPVKAHRVRQWSHRRQVMADEHGRYLLADVLSMLDTMAAVA
jgi:hypothetical protein